jgi:hypothetical protein
MYLERKNHTINILYDKQLRLKTIFVVNNFLQKFQKTKLHAVV